MGEGRYFIEDLERNDFSVVLSGGASYGIAHLGLIAFLEKHSLVPNEVLGTSIGAIVAGMYTIGKGVEYMENVLEYEKDTNLFEARYSRGRIEYRRISALLKKVFGEKKMVDAAIDLKIIATNVSSGQKRAFTKEDDVRIYDAVGASIAIPGVFSPKKVLGTFYIDGGVSSNLPIECAKKSNIKLASNVINGTNWFKYKKKNGVFSRLRNNFSVLRYTIHYLVENQTSSKTPYIEKLILIEPNLNGFNKYSFKNYKDIIDIGRKAVADKIGERKKNEK